VQSNDEKNKLLAFEELDDLVQRGPRETKTAEEAIPILD